jgi:pantoate--beta-alanine ligase
VKRTLGLVPTMGCLHQGHLSLVERAREENETLVVSVFVNPAQFGPQEDLATYPRDMERDMALLEGRGSDIVFAPPAEEMYPPGYDTWVVVDRLARRLEGEARPGHFRGVATVVAKLFNIVRPDRAYFGQKDGQQAAVIKRMASDLNMGVQVAVLPTVREPDGLAMSSRNIYLTPEQRKAAPALYRALSRVRELWQGGERDAERLRREARAALEAEPLVEAIDYVSVADAETLEELDTVDRPTMVSLAVRIGRARLIDNVVLR